MRTPSTLLRTYVSFLLVAFIAGCGSNSNNPSDPNAFAVHPAATSAAVGGTVALQATLAAQDVTDQTTWTVSDNSIADVESNVLRGKSPGKVTVSGTFKGTSTASTTLTIMPAAPVITWSQPADVPAATVLSSTQLNATANVPGTFAYNPAAGTVLQAGTQTLNATFTPSDSKVYSTATVSRTINVTASSTQTPTLTAVQISGSPGSVQSGQTIQLVATAVYSDNSTAVVTGTATWNSSNTPIATVSAGKVAGVTAGTAQISASYNGVSSAPTTITVSAKSATLTAIQISGGSTVAASSSVQLKATGTYSDQTTKDITSSVTWASSQNAVATVQGGTVTGVAAGTTNITASLNGVTSSPAAITVSAKSATLTAIQISGGSTVAASSSVQLKATGTYSDQTTKDITSSVTWASSQNAVATVQGGTVTGVAAGTTNITASLNGVTSAPTAITVSAKTATLTAIQISGSSTVATSSSVQLKATGTYSDQTTQDITSTVSWASSKQSVATVQGGLAIGVGAGTTSITASLSGVTGSATIQVTSGYVVQIDPSMSQSQIQSKISGSQSGDTIAFAAGTYNLANAGLNIPAGRTFLGSTTGTTMLSGSGGYSLMVFSGDGLTIQNITFDGGGVYLGGPVTNVHIEYNTFQNIKGPYGNWPAEIAIVMDTSAANSDISYNKFTNIGGDILNQYYDEVFSGGIFGKGLSNTTIVYNTFDTFNEGIHIFYDNLDGKNVQINNNTFVRGHRIAIEQQDGKAGGLEIAYNKVSQPLNAWALTFGLSIAATSNSGTGISVHDNVVNADTPLGATCAGSGCYYPYGVEAWGAGTQVYNNTIEGLWNHGVAIGAASNLSVTNNYICGPSMAQNNTFVDFEYGSEPGTVIQGNTTSASMTCGTGN